MTPMFASLLIPSRQRPAGLIRTIESVNSSTHDLSGIEMFVKIDDDDDSMMSRITEFCAIAKFPVYCWVGPRKGGYIHLHHFVNKMTEWSIGQWVWLLNDDCTIETDGWDSIVKGLNLPYFCHVLRFRYPYPDKPEDNPNNIFPLVQRGLVARMGHFSQTMYNDNYVSILGQDLGLEVNVPQIVIKHTMVHDKTRKDSEIQYVTQIPPEEQAEIDRVRAEGINRVRAHMTHIDDAGEAGLK